MIKRLLRSILILLGFPAAVSVLPAAGENPAIAVRRIQPADSSIAEEWERVTNERDLFGVAASRIDRNGWTWQIFINAGEFVRTDPLESRLNDAVAKALAGVKGVTRVAHEDREVWLIQGAAGGEALVRSCAAAVDGLGPDLRKYLQELIKSSAN